MKKIIWVAALCFASVHCLAQGKYGFEAGIGYTTYNKSYITTALQGYWLGRLTHSFYFGGALSFQRYSLLFSYNPSPTALAFGDILNLRQKSDYLFITPKIEMGIGRYKHFFANFSMGPGIYMGGNQWTHQYLPFAVTPSGANFGTDTAFSNTSYNVTNIIFRITGGLKQRFTTYRYWNIVVSEEFSYLPGKISSGSPELKTNYFCLTVGIMHKYPSVAMDED